MVTITATITKAEPRDRTVRGFASASTIGGKALFDAEGDLIEIGELRKAAHAFMQGARAGKVMHDGKVVAEVVESVVIDKAMQEALGVDLEVEGWWIAMKIHDDAVWERVMKGELRAFSIGGRGVRREIAA